MLGRVILALDVPYGGEKEGISHFLWGKLVVGLPAGNTVLCHSGILIPA